MTRCWRATVKVRSLFPGKQRTGRKEPMARSWRATHPRPHRPSCRSGCILTSSPVNISCRAEAAACTAPVGVVPFGRGPPWAWSPLAGDPRGCGPLWLLLPRSWGPAGRNCHESFDSDSRNEFKLSQRIQTLATRAFLGSSRTRGRCSSVAWLLGWMPLCLLGMPPFGCRRFGAAALPHPPAPPHSSTLRIEPPHSRVPAGRDIKRVHCTFSRGCRHGTRHGKGHEESPHQGFHGVSCPCPFMSRAQPPHAPRPKRAAAPPP